MTCECPMCKRCPYTDGVHWRLIADLHLCEPCYLDYRYHVDNMAMLQELE